MAAPALDTVRATAPPVIDRLGPIAYTDLNLLLAPGFPRLALNYWKSCSVPDLSDAVVQILEEQFAVCPSTMSKLIVERPHGAALRRLTSATAFPHRAPSFSIMILAQWHAPGESARNIAWARKTYDRLQPHSQADAYSNYLGHDEPEARVRDAFGGNFGRLQALKDRYDPRNILHLN